MKDLSRPLLATLAVLSIMTAGLTFSSLSAGPTVYEEDGWEYSIEGSFPSGSITIESYVGSSESATIPAKIDGMHVKNVRSDALGLPLKSVSVDPASGYLSSYDGILYYGTSGFTQLIECPDGRTDPVVIPNSVTKVYDKAFKNCANLSSISIPASVTTISGNKSFEGSGLTEPLLTDDGSRLISYLPNLTSTLGTEYTIPNSVDIIGRDAFSGCTGLTSVTIPDSVTTVGISAFSGCTNLATAYVPSTASLGSNCFPATTNIVYYDPPVSITSGQEDVSIITGTNFSYNVVTTPADATISVSGASWLNVNGHLIYGTVSEPGEYTITVSAYKDGYSVGSQSFTVTAASGLVFISGPSAGYIVQAGGQ